jgi:hypothetical protein
MEIQATPKRMIATQKNGTFISQSIEELVRWRRGKDGSRLLLPPIQRSLVWTNEQIINYWDILLRGYPSGMMMIHRLAATMDGVMPDVGRDIDNNTVAANPDDYLLFDGQQRVATILLGFDVGHLRNGRKLWIDLGTEPTNSSGLKFQLRISSTGQPFGYRPDAPNQKVELAIRRRRWDDWNVGRHVDELQDAFSQIVGSDLIQQKCAVPFAEVCNSILSLGLDMAIASIIDKEGASPQIVVEFMNSLSSALKHEIVFQVIPSPIVAIAEEYIRLFGPVGQGGTRLSDDELTYSIIKHNYPQIHDRIHDVVTGHAGRLANEVDIVLSALRLSKTMSPWEGAKEWELIGRPSPSFVSRLKELRQVESQFLSLIMAESEKSPLEDALNALRDALSYDSGKKSNGLPVTLLAFLPRELIDVLLLFAIKQGADQPWTEEHRHTLCAFVLYWLVFVADDGEAAWYAFQCARDERWTFSKETVTRLVAVYEKEGTARCLPRLDELTKLRKQVNEGDYHLRAWAERFTAADTDRAIAKPGEALRVMSTDRNRIKRALMWIQRQYIESNYPNYDPTSDRDDDLPIDLDHIVPWNIFDFDWRQRETRLEKDAISDEFRWLRKVVGNSIGNFRWLDASENRRLGKGKKEWTEECGGLILNGEEWNSIIPSGDDHKPWSLRDVALFQQLIDSRTIALYEELLVGGGIDSILPKNPDDDGV